eukprot:458734_1
MSHQKQWNKWRYAAISCIICMISTVSSQTVDIALWEWSIPSSNLQLWVHNDMMIESNQIRCPVNDRCINFDSENSSITRYSDDIDTTNMQNIQVTADISVWNSTADSFWFTVHIICNSVSTLLMTSNSVHALTSITNQPSKFYDFNLNQNAASLPAECENNAGINIIVERHGNPFLDEFVVQYPSTATDFMRMNNLKLVGEYIIPPTSDPTLSPTMFPTMFPTSNSATPTQSPTELPTMFPTSNSATPTKTPTSAPSTNPSKTPTAVPTLIPTEIPTLNPSNVPSSDPSKTPTEAPTQSPIETGNPTKTPTEVPTTNPSQTPTEGPTEAPEWTTCVDEFGLFGDVRGAVSIETDTERMKMRITLRGPSDKWFGIGFGNTVMFDTYAIVVHGETSDIRTQQLVLGNHTSGRIVSNAFDSEESGDVAATRVVSIVRDWAVLLDDDSYDFTDFLQCNVRKLPVIWAYGSNLNFGFHGEFQDASQQLSSCVCDATDAPTVDPTGVPTKVPSTVNPSTSPTLSVDEETKANDIKMLFGVIYVWFIFIFL